MKKLMFVFFAVMMIAALTIVSCPPTGGQAPTEAPGATATPTANPNLVIFGDGAFGASLTNTRIMNTDTNPDTAISITGGKIVIPVGTNVDIRFDLINASAFSKAVFTLDAANGGTVFFYSYDTVNETGQMFVENWGDSLWTTPDEIAFVNLVEVVYDPGATGFQSTAFDGFGLYSAGGLSISRIELQP